MHTLSVCLYLEEKPLEGRTGVRAHVFNLDMGQTVEQQQREASNWLEPLATDKERLLCLLSTEQSFTHNWEFFSVTHYSCTSTYTCSIHWWKASMVLCCVPSTKQCVVLFERKLKDSFYIEALWLTGLYNEERPQRKCLLYQYKRLWLLMEVLFALNKDRLKQLPLNALNSSSCISIRK